MRDGRFGYMVAIAATATVGPMNGGRLVRDCPCENAGPSSAPRRAVDVTGGPSVRDCRCENVGAIVGAATIGSMYRRLLVRDGHFGYIGTIAGAATLGPMYGGPRAQPPRRHDPIGRM